MAFHDKGGKLAHPLLRTPNTEQGTAKLLCTRKCSSAQDACIAGMRYCAEPASHLCRLAIQTPWEGARACPGLTDTYMQLVRIGPSHTPLSPIPQGCSPGTASLALQCEAHHFCVAGAREGRLPPFPYACTSMRLLKRSRSDTAEVRLGPTLRSILGSRWNLFRPFRASVCSASEGPGKGILCHRECQRQSNFTCRCRHTFEC